MSLKKDFNYYHSILTSLSCRDEIKNGQLQEGLRYILQELSGALEVKIVGLWNLDSQKTFIKNELSFRSEDKKFFSGEILYKQSAPKYFKAIFEEQVIVADNALTHAATSELADSYLIPNQISSLLDVPVLVEGDFIGIICCENDNPQRVWTTDEKYFVSLAAHLISNLIENDRRLKLLRLVELENLVSGEAQIKNLLMSLPISLAVLDRDSKYLAMSDSWRNNFVFNTANPIGKYVWDCHENYQQFWIDRIRLAQSGERLRKDEELIKGPDGSDVWITWQLEPWRNFQGQHSGIVVICDNITLKKEADIKLNHTAKLTALGEMAGGIAHEINNPLSILKGFVDLMQKKINQGQFIQTDFEQYLQKSSTTINRISRVVRAMKKISRDSSRDPLEQVSLNLLIEDARDFMSEKFKSKEIDFQIQVPDDEVYVQCRGIEISQVLLNLLTNSYQALESIGWVNIQLSYDSEQKKARIVITDSGHGIPAEFHDKIFQPFFTTKDVGFGTGLGLSISRKIIESHKGQLTLNPDSENTQFIIEL